MTRTHVVMSKLAAANPLADDDLQNWAITNDGRSIAAAILQETANNLPATPPRTFSWKLPLRSLAGSAALILIAGAVLLLPQDDRSNNVPRDGNNHRTTARGVLQGAALVAARDDRLDAGPGQYIYTRMTGQGSGTIEVNGRQITALIPTTIEHWVADDHSGRVVSSTGEPQFLSEEDRQWWQAGGSPPFSEVGTAEKRLPSRNNNPEDYNTYPTEPDELHDLLMDKARASHADDPESYVFTIASSILLQSPEAPPALRSALFDVMSRAPGVGFDRGATDPEGRPAAMVWVLLDEDGDRHQRYEVYFDPDKAQVLAFRSVFLDPGQSATGEGRTHSYAVLLEAAVVDSTTERP